MLGSLWLWSPSSGDALSPWASSLSPSDFPSAVGQMWPPECSFQQSLGEIPSAMEGNSTMSLPRAGTETLLHHLGKKRPKL